MAQKCIWQPQPLTDSQILKRSGNGLCSKHTAVAPILDVVYSINAIIQQLMTSELEGCDHYIIHNISSPVTSITTIHKTDNWSNSNSYFNHNSRLIHCWHNLFFFITSHISLAAYWFPPTIRNIQIYRNMIIISTLLDLNSVLAHSQCVPQLDGFVSWSRHDLAIVGRKCNAQHVLRVTNETSSRPPTVSDTQISNIPIFKVLCIDHHWTVSYRF